MGCSGCSRKKVPTTQTFRVKVDVPVSVKADKIRDITIKLKTYAKELVNEA